MLEPEIEGSKGSSKGGGGTEANNTLRSDARLRLVELLSEGPIVGLISGGKSILLQDTPLINDNNTVNFKGVQWETRTGLPSQTVLLGNAQTETPYQVGVQCKFNVTSQVRTISDTNSTSARVVVRIPTLSNTDTKTGAIKATSVSWAVDVQPNGGAWTRMAQVNLVNQKCNSAYQQASQVILPAGGCPWNIRVVRLTADSTKTTLQNDTFWDSYTTIVEGQFTYPNSAIVALNIDADLFNQGSIPSRTFHVKGLIISVPTNYDPITRIYTGIWNGTFQNAWTNNPAWIFYDLLVSDRYGIGEFIDASKIDKWSLYQIAQYCDQLVPNGFGGTEPRFTFNGVLTGRAEAYKVLQQITTAFRGMAYWSLGSVYAVADMPKDPVKLASPANVVDGQFNYTGTALKTRHSVAIVSWNNPLQFYKSTPEVYVNDTLLNQYGWREVSIQAVGCTSRGQAVRYAKWVLDTEQYATETVEYVASWDHADLKPGDIVAIADPRKAQVRAGGRIAANPSALTYTLDQAFVPNSGQTYNLMVEKPDGTVETKLISTFVGQNVTVTTDFSTVPLIGTMWVITGTDIKPRQYRVLSVTETDKHLLKITALFHDPTKFARIEQNINLDPVAYTLPKTTILPPNNFAANEILFMQNGTAGSSILLSWTPAGDYMAKGYQITAQTPNGIVNYGMVTMSSLQLDNVVMGAYVFYISSVGINGRTSPPTSLGFTTQGWAATAAPYVTHLEITNSGANNTFSGQDCRLDWRNNFPGSTYDVAQNVDSDPSVDNPFYRDNVVQIIDFYTGVVLRTDIVYMSSYTYTYQHNIDDNLIYSRGPVRKFIVSVKVRDNLGRVSDPVNITVNNPVPDLIIPNVTGGLQSIFITFVKPSDADYRGVIVWQSTDINFDPTITVPVYDGPNNNINLTGVQFATYYIRVAGYDAFNKSNLNISPPIQIIVDGIHQDTTSPAVPTGLALTTAVVTTPEGVVKSSISATWDVSPSSNFSYFIAEIQQGSGTAVDYQISSSNFIWDNLISNQSYSVRLAAVSKNGFRSAFSGSVNIVAAAKVSAPNMPTSFAVAASLKSAFLTWVNPADTDTDHIEVWQNLTNTLGTAALVGNIKGTMFSQSGLITATTYFYWIRAVNTSGVQSSFSSALSVTPGQVANGDIAAGTITADRLNVITLSAIAANIGTVNAGIVQSTDGKTVLNLTAGSLTISD